MAVPLRWTDAVMESGARIRPATQTTMRYLVNESASTTSVDDPDWAAEAQTTYTFAREGAKTLYAWAKDATGNISSSASDGVTITLPTAHVSGSFSGSEYMQ